MSSFVNYFAPLAQDERTPIAREPVKNPIRNRRSIARVARRRAIERQRTDDAQVEHNESLTRNIKSNLYLASRTDSFRQGARLLRRGERTVPRRYIKSAHWLKVGRDEGYFAVYQGAYLPIEFNHEHCYWYCVKYSDIRRTWETLSVAPFEYFLDIQNEEVVSRNDWEVLAKDEPKTDDKEELEETPIRIRSIVAEEDRLGSAMERTLSFSYLSGRPIARSDDPPGGEPPHGNGGDDDEETPDDFNRRERRHAEGDDKLIGREPTVFTGDRKDAESFLLEWQIYQMMNHETTEMRRPFTRAALLLSYIKGPAVHEWSMLQINWLATL
jgi:hypothetical protein